MKDFYIYEVPMILIGILVPFLILGLSAVALVGWHRCNGIESMIGVETHYRVLDACYVKNGDGWMHYGANERRNNARYGLESIADSIDGRQGTDK